MAVSLLSPYLVDNFASNPNPERWLVGIFPDDGIVYFSKEEHSTEFSYWLRNKRLVKVGPGVFFMDDFTTGSFETVGSA